MIKKGKFLLAAIAVAFAQGRAEVPAEVIDEFRGAVALGADALTADNLDAARAEVWRAWCEANRSESEACRLPGLQPLTDSITPAAWHIPPELEPDAVMPFYYGFKGESDAPLPLFIYLHGSGPKAGEWSTGLKLAGRFDDAPSAYFIPQIPNEGEYYRWWQRGKQFTWERLLRLALASGAIDPDRIYLFGISEGGYGSQRLASFYADYLAGAGPMAGGEPLKNAPAENLRNTAFSLRTGSLDRGFYRNMLTRRTAAELDSLQALYGDFTHSVELVADAGHAIDYSPTTPWLSRFRRNYAPTRVSWEDFDMDGRHRTGFYNLLVEERPAERTRYDLDVCGNRVNLRVDTVSYRTTVTDPHWGIALDFERSYARADRGCVTIFLGPELVDLSQPVEVTVNDRTVFTGLLPLSADNLMRSCEAYFDPRRLYPAAVTVTLHP